MSVILAERQRPEPDVVVIRASTATRAYVSSGIHRDRLKVAVPYEIAIDL